jgi:hypothetical protein
MQKRLSGFQRPGSVGEVAAEAMNYLNTWRQRRAKEDATEEPPAGDASHAGLSTSSPRTIDGPG